MTQVRTVTEYEAYYLDRHHLLPLPAIFIQLNDPQRSMYYMTQKQRRLWPPTTHSRDETAGSITGCTR